MHKKAPEIEYTDEIFSFDELREKDADTQKMKNWTKRNTAKAENQADCQKNQTVTTTINTTHPVTTTTHITAKKKKKGLTDTGADLSGPRASRLLL